MKILLLGEFSGVHFNLSLGLKRLGHEVIIASKGDGFKKIESEIQFYNRSNKENNIIGVLKEIKSQMIGFNQLKNFDIVQPTTFEFFHNRIDDYLFERVIKNNKKSVMLNTSCSTPYNEFVKSLEYSACKDCMEFDLKSTTCSLEFPRYKRIEFERYKLFDAFVSTHFEYFHSFNESDLKTRNHFIPLPFDISRCENTFNAPTDKIVLYYGELRKGFKGGLYIEKALQKLRESKYSKHFEIIQTNRLSLKEYNEVLAKSHVLIDQSSSYSYGMNALNGLAQGKIVFTGAEDGAISLMGAKQSENPLINIKPNEDLIFEEIIKLLDNRESLIDRSNLGVKFVKKFHDIDTIAEKYVRLYSSLENLSK